VPEVLSQSEIEAMIKVSQGKKGQQIRDNAILEIFYASGMRAGIFSFLKEKKGNIINISSVSGILGMPRQTNYSATKGGMNAFTRSLAKEVANYGIRVNAVAPGFIETDILSGLSEELIEEIKKSIPLGRIGDVADVVGCVKFLLSDESAYLIGQTLVVDGGLAMR